MRDCLHYLLRLHAGHHLPDLHVLCHAAHHGLSLQPHVHAGAFARQAHRRPPRAKLHSPANQHEGGHHVDHPAGDLHRLLGSLLPPPHPDDFLPPQPLLCVFHVTLQHVSHPDHVQLGDRPTHLRLQESGDEEDFQRNHLLLQPEEHLR